LHAVRGSEPPLNVLAVGFDPGEPSGVNVETADDLLGALARLADGGIDVVLLSLDLPDGGGADAVRSIRDRAPDVPVIAIVTDRGGERAIDEGASDVLAADAGPELLSRAIRYTTALGRMEAELQRRLVVDELTGLYNARGLEHIASHHLAMADRSKRPVTLVFVRLDAIEDLDDVADVEERRTVVADTAEVLRGAVRSSDVLARVGAGSFCVLLTGDVAGAEGVVLSRLVEAIAASNARSGRTAQLSISVGAAAYDPERPVSFDELIAQAERRMRRAGGDGRPG
jgi:diguanylate cyclase (GGDEF)-like protein